MAQNIAITAINGEQKIVFKSINEAAMYMDVGPKRLKRKMDANEDLNGWKFELADPEPLPVPQQEGKTAQEKAESDTPIEDFIERKMKKKSSIQQIVAIHPDGRKVLFNSSNQASHLLKCGRGSIVACTSGMLESYGGWAWENYIEGKYPQEEFIEHTEELLGSFSRDAVKTKAFENESLTNIILLALGKKPKSAEPEREPTHEELEADLVYDPETEELREGYYDPEEGVCFDPVTGLAFPTAKRAERFSKIFREYRHKTFRGGRIQIAVPKTQTT